MSCFEFFLGETPNMRKKELIALFLVVSSLVFGCKTADVNHSEAKAEDELPPMLVCRSTDSSGLRLTYKGGAVDPDEHTEYKSCLMGRMNSCYNGRSSDVVDLLSKLAKELYGPVRESESPEIDNDAITMFLETEDGRGTLVFGVNKRCTSQTPNPNPPVFVPVYEPYMKDCVANESKFEEVLKPWNAKVDSVKRFYLSANDVCRYIVRFPNDRSMYDYFKKSTSAGIQTELFKRGITVNRDGSDRTVNVDVAHVSDQYANTCKRYMCDNESDYQVFLTRYKVVDIDSSRRRSKLIGIGMKDEISPFTILSHDGTLGERCAISGTVESARSHLEFLEARLKAGAPLSIIKDGDRCFSLYVYGHTTVSPAGG
jgi:hypothetical protein